MYQMISSYGNTFPYVVRPYCIMKLDEGAVTVGYGMSGR